MKEHAKWIATAVAVAAGLAVVSPARAQGVTGTATLNNLVPGEVTLYAGWSDSPPTVVTYGSTGLEIASLNYGSLYYATPGSQLPALSTADTEVSLTFTINGPAGSYYVGVPFIINDSTGPETYGGYATYSPGTYTENAPLDATQLAAVAAGGDTIYGFNLEFDPAGNVPAPGNYDITFNSLTLSPVAVPEPATLQLIGLGAAGFLAWRRRNK
jgi:PEP-CTERM motif